MLIFFLLSVCIIKVDAQPKTFKNNFIAIQNDFETYLSYLPYVETCNYNQQGMYQGSITIDPLDGQDLFSAFQYQGQINFWETCQNGLALMYTVPRSIIQYSGYILYNSPITRFQRPLILFTLNQTNLTFSYAVPSLNQQNMTLNITITSTVPIQLPSTAWQILNECGTSNSSNFAYLGNHSFIYVCGAAAAGFSFVPTVNNESEVQIYNFSESIGVGNYRITSNPDIYLQQNNFKYLFWNAGIQKTQNQTSQLFILILNNSKLVVEPLSQLSQNFFLIVNRLWSYQTKKQIDRWMNIYSLYNISSDFYFPDDIVSLFVTDNDIIFVQSVDVKGKTYLCVFNGEGNLFWNVSFMGTVLLYGAQTTLIYNQQKFIVEALTIQRPIFAINTSWFEDTTANTMSYLNITIPCDQADFTLQYTILWTSPQYPSGYIVTKQNGQLFSTDSAFGLEVSKNFQIIGPGFQLVANPLQQIQIFTINEQSVAISKNVIGIVNVYEYLDNQYNIIVFTKTSIYSLSVHGGVHTLAFQPCGFSQILKAYPYDLSHYIIVSSEGNQCICSSNFRQCTLNGGPSNPNQVNSNNKTKQYVQIELQTNSQSMIPLSQVKKNLHQLVQRGYLVSILTNNSAILIDLKTYKILDMVSIKCLLKYNQTDGTIFIKQFYNPSLILFCQDDTSLWQYVIKNDQLIYERIIPLYRFKTKTSQWSIRQARSYIFLQVDPIYQFYPNPRDCCVLRLDVCVFTVSVIQQVINYNSIILTGFYGNIDLVVLNSYVNSQYSVLKLYLPNKWMVFNQSNASSVVTNQQQVVVYFQSPIFNFYSYQSLTISFNLTNFNLNFLNINKEEVIYFPQESSAKGQLPIYSKTIQYNLSEILCGPVIDLYFQRGNLSEQNLQIEQTDVIVKSKLIGNIGINFIQIIDPSNWDQWKLSLNNLLLFISVDKMYVYSKIRNNVQMSLVTQFFLPQKNCLYYLYIIVNQTAAQLNSNCQGLNFNLQSPLLLINYQEQTNDFTYSSSFLKIPFQLRDIFTIPLTNVTYIVGIKEGPMRSDTGRLVICSDISCSYLFVSTSTSFLINYAAHMENDTFYYVMSIDTQTIQVFVCPEPQSPANITFPNFTINYSKYVNQTYCSTMRIINASGNISTGILSCSSYYYYYQMHFNTSSMIVINKFVRYSLCALYDNFKPYVVYNETGLKIIFAQCRQNDFNVKLQTYNAILTPSPVFTGFMQIFMLNGPLGPNCSSDSISASKILQLSSTMQRPIFCAYKVDKIHKFIYSEINGILIDNFVFPDPKVSIRFQPININYQFPNVNLYVINQYHSKNQTFRTDVSIFLKFKTVHLIIFLIFIGANLITLVFLLLYLFQKKVGDNNKNEQQQQQNSANEVVFKPEAIIQAAKSKRISSIGNNGEVQLFFTKTKKNRNNTIKIKEQMLKYRQTINAKRISSISKTFQIQLQSVSSKNIIK